MEPIRIVSDEEARAIYWQGEDAVVELIHSMNRNFIGPPGSDPTLR